MPQASRRPVRWLALLLLAAALILGLATGIFWDDLMKTALDPKTPFQTYKPPRAPDYSQAAAWWLLPGDAGGAPVAAAGADVFFIAPTAFDGGREWNAPIGAARAERVFRQVMAPN